MVCAKTSSVVVLQDVLKISFVLMLTAIIGCGGGAVTPPVNNGPSQAVIALASGSSTIVQGQSTTLTWKATNAVSFSITPAVASGALPLSGSATVSPAAT